MRTDLSLGRLAQAKHGSPCELARYGERQLEPASARACLPDVCKLGKGGRHFQAFRGAL
jgi:hypothetical protein